MQDRRRLQGPNLDIFIKLHDLFDARKRQGHLALFELCHILNLLHLITPLGHKLEQKKGYDGKKSWKGNVWCENR
jgi:hypothetical protein